MKPSITLPRPTAPDVHYEWMVFPQPDGTATFNITTTTEGGEWTCPETVLASPMADEKAVRLEVSIKVWTFIAVTNGLTIAEAKALGVRNW